MAGDRRHHRGRRLDPDRPACGRAPPPHCTPSGGAGRRLTSPRQTWREALRIPYASKQDLSRSLLLVGATIALLELLTRLPVGFHEPGLILYPLILYVAFRHGFWSGIAGAALGAAYVMVEVLLLGRLIGPTDSMGWRLMVVVIGLPGAAVAIGLLRSQFDEMLARERAAREAIRAEREHTSLILDSIADGVVAMDRDWRITYANPVGEKLLGHRRQELVGRDARDLFPDLETNVFYHNYARALQEQVPVHFEAASLVSSAWFEVHGYPSTSGLTVFFRDITERHRQEQRLQTLSLMDELTGLYNRRGFFTLARQQCKHSERKHQGLLLMFVDLDGLKRINDTHGHVIGDQVLVALADALRRTFRESDILGRLGGDEFAALALEADPDAITILLDRLAASVEEINQRKTLSVTLSVSVGTAFLDPGKPCSIEELLALADTAMYTQKRDKLAGNESGSR